MKQNRRILICKKCNKKIPISFFFSARRRLICPECEENNYLKGNKSGSHFDMRNLLKYCAYLMNYSLFAYIWLKLGLPRTPIFPFVVFPLVYLLVEFLMSILLYFFYPKESEVDGECI